jgi:two-component system nitrogen regulation response regulator NtrX
MREQQRMATILVIDDEPGIRSAVRGILEDEGHNALVAEDAVVGLELIERGGIDLVLLDVWLPRMGGIEALGRMKSQWPDLVVIVISGHGNVEMAVKAIKLGAYDFIEKPLSIERLVTSTRNALEAADLRKENRTLRQKQRFVNETEDLVGSSEAMREVRALALQAATSDARVLITGENGTGKELLARFIHGKSPRASGPFVALNCAAMPEGLVESELFGHEKGAFTDAVARRIGRFEAAHGGTLFLDEVADLSPAAQAKLLRVLQDMRFERVGGETTVEVDVRVVCATNKDVKAEVAAGRFREDLYFRLAVILIRMPSLKERTEDIAELARLFLNMPGEAHPRRLSDGAAAALAARSWPGNVRELKNAMERLRVLSDEEPFQAATVERILGVQQNPGHVDPGTAIPGRFLALGLQEAKENFERDYLAQKLKDCDYNISRTAEAIGVYPSGLHAKIKKLGIELEK